MKLKSYLKKRICAETNTLRKLINQHQTDLELLDKINPRDFIYRIYLHSCWANEGEKSTTSQYKGTLNEAIKRAEEEFKLVNHRSDVQANYAVSVVLGKEEYALPESFWRKYRSVL